MRRKRRSYYESNGKAPAPVYQRSIPTPLVKFLVGLWVETDLVKEAIKIYVKDATSAFFEKNVFSVSIT
jgi:hypothetical protein